MNTILPYRKKSDFYKLQEMLETILSSPANNAKYDRDNRQDKQNVY